MTSPLVTQDDYASAVQIPSLDVERGRQLVEHILRSNHAFPDCPPIPLPVARCAAALLAADPDRLSSPTALAQAAALAQKPKIGPAVMHLHEGLMLLAELRAADLAVVGTHQFTLRRSLQYLVERASELIQRL
jgi:nucleotide-binding universal stress UspA family protein